MCRECVDDDDDDEEADDGDGDPVLDETGTAEGGVALETLALNDAACLLG